VPAIELSNGKLMYNGRLVLAKTSEWIPKILIEYHKSKLGGHSGFFRTYKRISSILYWEGMKAAIMNFVRFAKRISILHFNLRAYFSHFLSLLMCGLTYLWTSLVVCQKPREWTQSL